MNKFKKDRSKQSLIFGYNVEDFIPENHLARVVEAIVDALDTKNIENNYSEIGQKSYNPKLMIKILFYGYAIGVYSSRKIKQGCEQDLPFMYLSNLYKPDHRTISDFRKKYLRELKSYFVDILKYCNELGFMQAGTIAIDGSKFRANASSKRSKDIQGYKKWEKRLKEEIKNRIKKAEAIDEEDNERLSRHQIEKIKKEIYQRENLIKKIQQAKAALKRQEAEYSLKEKQSRMKINLTDRDAMYQKERQGVIAPNYNAQIAVNDKQIIVGADISQCASDRQLLQPMVEQVEENTGEKVNEILADAGYSSYNNYEYIDKKNIDGYIPDQNYRQTKKHTGQKLYDKTCFTYNAKKDEYICPAGERLIFYKSRNDASKPNRKIYKGLSCTGCKIRSKCTNAQRAPRTIMRHDAEQLQEKMREKLNTEKGQKKYYKRMNLCEAPFGHLKKNLKFRQFFLRGLEQVKGEFAILCIGYNIKKIFQFQMGYV